MILKKVPKSVHGNPIRSGYEIIGGAVGSWFHIGVNAVGGWISDMYVVGSMC